MKLNFNGLRILSLSSGLSWVIFGIFPRVEEDWHLCDINPSDEARIMAFLSRSRIIHQQW